MQKYRYWGDLGSAAQVVTRCIKHSRSVLLCSYPSSTLPLHDHLNQVLIMWLRACRRPPSPTRPCRGKVGCTGWTGPEQLTLIPCCTISFELAPSAQQHIYQNYCYCERFFPPWPYQKYSELVSLFNRLDHVIIHVGTLSLPESKGLVGMF